MNLSFSHRVRAAILIASILLVAAPDGSARITRSRPSASSGTKPSLLTPFYSLVIGGGVEWQREREQTEWGFPILIEYNVTEQFKLTIEPAYKSIRSRTPGGRSVSGWGDLETTVDYELVRERRYRPSLSLEGAIRWPTAEDPELGEPGRDYTIGLVASKDLVVVEFDLNLLYTFTSDGQQRDGIEAALAATWHVNGYFDLIAEIANVSQVGNSHGLFSGERHETEATAGIGWIVNKYLTLEQGIVFKEHGVWEAIFAWEWSFGGE